MSYLLQPLKLKRYYTKLRDIIKNETLFTVFISVWKTILTIKLDTWARHWAYTFIIIIIIVVHGEVTIYQKLCMAAYSANVMYSTCNGSNDEFKIDYGGLSLKVQ